MKDTYKITFPFDGLSKFNEVTIESENLIYSEINEDLCGIQTNSSEEAKSKIKENCNKIANLIREIEELK